MEPCGDCDTFPYCICPRCSRSFCAIDHAVEHMNVYTCSGTVDLDQFVHTNQTGEEIRASSKEEHNILSASNELERHERFSAGEQGQDAELSSNSSDYLAREKPLYIFQDKPQPAGNEQAERDYNSHVKRLSVKLCGHPQGKKPQWNPILDHAIYNVKFVGEDWDEDWLQARDTETLQSAYLRLLERRFRIVLLTLSPDELSGLVARTVLATYRHEAEIRQLNIPTLHEVVLDKNKTAVMGVNFYLIPTVLGPLSRPEIFHVARDSSIRKAVSDRFMNGNPTFLVSRFGPDSRAMRAQYVIDQRRTALPGRIWNKVTCNTVEAIDAMIEIVEELKRWICAIEEAIFSYGRRRTLNERCEALLSKLIRVKRKSGIEWIQVKEEIFFATWIDTFWHIVRRGAKDKVWSGAQFRDSHASLKEYATHALDRQGNLVRPRLTPPPHAGQDLVAPRKLQVALRKMRHVWIETQ